MAESGLVASASHAATQRISLPRRLRRVVLVALNYRFSQVARRVVKLAKQRLRPRAVVGARPALAAPQMVPPLAALDGVSAIVVSSFANHISHSHSDLRQGKLSLLSEIRDLGFPIRWDGWANDNAPSHLWRFQLQYHEFLLSFVADMQLAGKDPWPVVADVLHGWINDHAPATCRRTSDAWHPYCISRRLAVWTWLMAASPTRLGESSDILGSYWVQADYLSRNLELDLGGNHLIENLTALAIAGAVVDCAEAHDWTRIAATYLKKELPRQVLPHGEHFERSPVYHCQILGNLLVIIALTQDAQLKQLCILYSSQMLRFVNAILLDDGEVPLFADSVWGESPSIHRIRQLATLVGLEMPLASAAGMHQVGGYAVFRGETPKYTIVVDAGSVGATELPAHAHCDLMNIEACFDGIRWITDTGNFDYEDSSMRRFCRSSSAHTVATVEGANHCDIWSKFRMVDQGEVVQLRSESEGPYSWCLGKYQVRFSHGKTTLLRIVVVSASGELIVVDCGPKGFQRPIVGFVQIGPEIEATVADTSNFSADLATGDSCKRLILVGCQAAELVQGWRCPAFGLRQSRSVVKYTGTVEAACGWMLLGEDTKLDVAIEGRSLSVQGLGGSLTIPF